MSTESRNGRASTDRLSVKPRRQNGATHWGTSFSSDSTVDVPSHRPPGRFGRGAGCGVGAVGDDCDVRELAAGTEDGAQPRPTKVIATEAANKTQIKVREIRMTSRSPRSHQSSIDAALSVSYVIISCEESTSPPI